MRRDWLPFSIFFGRVRPGATSDPRVWNRITIIYGAIETYRSRNVMVVAGIGTVTGQMRKTRLCNIVKLTLRV